jgi:hypothetical protein
MFTRILLVSIAEAAKLLLAGRVPAVEPQLAMARGEVQRAHLHTNGCCKTSSTSRRTNAIR